MEYFRCSPNLAAGDGLGYTSHMYKIGDVLKRLPGKWSDTTIKNWTKEFQRHLSPTANPGRGQTRVFTDDDLLFLNYVAERKRVDRPYDEIHVGLDNDQHLTLRLPSDSQELAVTDDQVIVLQRRIADMIAEHKVEVQELREQAAKAEGKVELLEQQLSQREQEIRNLYRELARYEAMQNHRSPEA